MIKAYFMMTLITVLAFARAVPPSAEIHIQLANQKIPLEISKKGEVRLKRYPTEWHSTLGIALMPGNSLIPDFSEQSCETILEKAKMESGDAFPPLAQAQLFDEIRNVMPVSVNADVSSILNPDSILQRAREEWAAQRFPSRNLELQNPLELTKIETELKFEPDSVSMITGRTDELKIQVQRLFEPDVLHTGIATGELNALDFLCDLKSGNAKVSVHLSGKELATPDYESLVPPSVGQAIEDRLRSEIDRFDQSSSALLGNREIAARLIEEELQGNNISLADDKFLSLVEKLTSSENGSPVLLSPDSLAGHLTVLVGDSTPYQGLVTVDMEESKP